MIIKLASIACVFSLTAALAGCATDHPKNIVSNEEPS